MVQERPPRLLEIFRDFVKPGSEAAFRSVEEDAARICAELGCPHPHLAIESLTGPMEVWWLNAFESEAQYQRAVDAYRSNRELTTALEEISKRREGLIFSPIDLLTTHRPHRSRDAPWKLGGARFFVAAMTKREDGPAGSVFEAPQGERFILRPVAEREEANSLASAAGAETRVFAVRPYWGMPASEWVRSDPDFWSESPTSRSRQV
jgi:hypothetical protein